MKRIRRSRSKQEPQKPSPPISRFADLVVVAAAFALAFVSQYPALTSQYMINDDARQLIYWLQQFRDAELFRGDLLTVYARHFSSLGFILFYRALAPFIDPLLLSRLLPLLLFPLACGYLYRLVLLIGGRYAALLAALSCLASPILLARTVGGLPRAFAFPLLLAFLYYLLKRQYLTTAILLFAQALFYPIIFFASAPVALVPIVRAWMKKGSLRPGRRELAIAAGIIISLSFLGHRYIYRYNPLIGKTVTRGEMAGQPEYTAAGRFPILPVPPLYRGAANTFGAGTAIPHSLAKSLSPLCGGRATGALAVIFSWGLLFFLLYEILRKRISLPLELGALLLSALLMYKLADLFLFKLFLPMRHLEYPLPLLAMITLSLAAAGLPARARPGKARLLLQAALVALMLLGSTPRNLVGLGLMDMGYLKRLCEHLKAYPKGTVIAAHPVLADGIPMFSGRTVFLKHELSNVWYDNYWRAIKRRTFDLFDAYFAEDLEEVYLFCRENKVDYLLIDGRHYKKSFVERGVFYFEPFNTYLRRLVATRKRYALANIPPAAKAYSEGEIFLVAAETIKELSDPD